MLSQSQGCFDFPFKLTFQSKRQLTFIGFAIRRFTVGINYAIVIPSLWFYLESFGAPYYFLGIAIAADSLVGIFVAPFVGKIADVTRRIRIIGSVTICLDIAGCITYALPLHVYMPILGRCISGLGSGYVSALYGEVARVTSPEERTRIVTILEGVRLLGITIGPSFNLFLQYFDFSIGPWKIDRRTAPGFFMAILWCLVGVIHLFTVYNLTKDYKHLEADFFENNVNGGEAKVLGDQVGSHGDNLGSHGDNLESHKDHGGTHKDHEGSHKDHGRSHGDYAGSHGEHEGSHGDTMAFYGDYRGSEGNYELRSSDDDDDGPGKEELTYFDILKTQIVHEDVKQNEEEATTFCQVLKVACSRTEVLVLFLTQFVMFFNQSSFETLAPLIGVVLLDFNITYLSLLYFAAGVELVIVIVLVWFVSRYIADRNLLLSSVAMGTIGVFAQLSVALMRPHTSGCLTMALLMTFFMLLATPITAIVGKSLLSKLTPPEDQGFYQGLLASTQQLGLISGPLVGSALFDYLTYFSSVTLFILLMLYIMTLSAMDKLIGKSTV